MSNPINPVYIVDNSGRYYDKNLKPEFLNNHYNFNILEGKTLVSIKNNNNKELIFTAVDGEVYMLFHRQVCCEDVYIEDICGNMVDLINTPIIRATEDTSNENPEDKALKYGTSEDHYQESFTWTFYNIATAKGHVTIRWYGESNGYCSESVDFLRLK